MDQLLFIPITKKNGTVKLGMLHRENDQPAIIHENGTQEWYFNGQRHRINKPAVVFPDGKEEWYCNGVLHIIQHTIK